MTIAKKKFLIISFFLIFGLFIWIIAAWISACDLHDQCSLLESIKGHLNFIMKLSL